MKMSATDIEEAWLDADLPIFRHKFQLQKPAKPNQLLYYQ